MKLLSVFILLVTQLTFAGVTTPDNFNLRFEDTSVSLGSVRDQVSDLLSNKPSIVILDGGQVYSGFISVEISVPDYSKVKVIGPQPKIRKLYALPLEADGTLSPLNQRVLSTLQKVASGHVTLKQIHTFDGVVKTAGDFSYKVIAAVSVGN